MEKSYQTYTIPKEQVICHEYIFFKNK